LEFGVLVFVEGEKPENPEKKTLTARQEPTTNSIYPHMAPGRNQTQATLVGGERSHHFVVPVLR